MKTFKPVIQVYENKKGKLIINFERDKNFNLEENLLYGSKAIKEIVNKFIVPDLTEEDILRLIKFHINNKDSDIND